MTKSKKQRFGIFYKTRGEWTKTPYAGLTFTKYSLNRRPVTDELHSLKNYVLKSRLSIRPVKA